MATFNADQVIESSLNSLKEQLFIDFELLIIDNESTDSTLLVVRKVFPDAIIISEPDRGIYDALNKGLRRATGDWVYILGADDKINSANTLVIFMDVLKTAPDYKMIYGNIVTVGKSSHRKIVQKPVSYYVSKGIKSPPLFHQSVFMCRDTAMSLGGFDESFVFHADHDLTSKFFSRYPSVYIDEVVAIYSNVGFSGFNFSTFIRTQKELITIGYRSGTSFLYWGAAS